MTERLDYMFGATVMMDMTPPRIIKKPGEFRKGKTQRDHKSGSWSQRIANQQARADAQNDRKKK